MKNASTIARLLSSNASRSAIAALALAAIGQGAAANLIANGSFEDPVVAPGTFQNFAAGSTAITGWTVVGVDSAITSGTFMQSGITFNAAEGAQFIDLAGVSANSMASGLTQSVATVAGTTYQLAFYVGGTSDGTLFFPATIDLSIDGGARLGFSNTAAPRDSVDWRLFTFDFVAESATTALTFFNGSASNNFFSGLDNVSLEAVGVPPPVPEPAEWALLSLGLAAVTAWQRRTRRVPTGAA